MKKIYTLILLSISISFSAQMEGTWKLVTGAGSMGCGDQGQGAMNWWSNSAADAASRACIFDDSITFSAAGNYMHYMDGNTWLEDWQGVASEQCGTPVAPHDGNGTYTWSMSGDTLTIAGTGGHLGLPKAVNGGEISTGAAVPTSISYIITMINGGNGFHADIQSAGNGAGWWRFTYQKTGAAPPPPPPTHTVTFNVHTDLIAGNVSADGIYIGGGFVGGNDALLLDDSDGDGIWSGSTSLDAAGGHFTILNGNCSDWSCKEDISGQSCADPANYNDRTNLVGGFSQDTTLNLQFGSCDNPTHIGQIENNISLYPNPTKRFLTIHCNSKINTLKVFNMIGNLVVDRNIFNNQTTLSIENIPNGMYFVVLKFDNGSIINSKFIKK